jgi:hypothetical protein
MSSSPYLTMVTSNVFLDRIVPQSSSARSGWFPGPSLLHGGTFKRGRQGPITITMSSVKAIVAVQLSRRFVPKLFQDELPPMSFPLIPVCKK